MPICNLFWHRSWGYLFPAMGYPEMCTHQCLYYFFELCKKIRILIKWKYGKNTCVLHSIHWQQLFENSYYVGWEWMILNKRNYRCIPVKFQCLPSMMFKVTRWRSSLSSTVIMLNSDIQLPTCNNFLLNQMLPQAGRREKQHDQKYSRNIKFVRRNGAYIAGAWNIALKHSIT